LQLCHLFVFDITVSLDRRSLVISYIVRPFVKPSFASDLVSPIFWRRRLLVDEIMHGSMEHCLLGSHVSSLGV